MALQQVYAPAAEHGDEVKAVQLLERWGSRARFKKLAGTLRERLPAAVRGMLDDRSNAYAEARSGQLQPALRVQTWLESNAGAVRSAYVDHVVLCEPAWVLARSCSDAREWVAAAIVARLEQSTLRVEAPHVVREALTPTGSGRLLGLSDCRPHPGCRV